MVNDDVLYGFRLRLFSLAAEIGNVREACRIFGIHPSTYYRWRGPVLRSGLEMLRPRACARRFLGAEPSIREGGKELCIRDGCSSLAGEPLPWQGGALGVDSKVGSLPTQMADRANGGGESPAIAVGDRTVLALESAGTDEFTMARSLWLGTFEP